MLFDKYLNTTFFYAPEAEVGAPEPDAAPPPPPSTDRSGGLGSGRSSLRQSLEKSFDDARKAEPKEEADERDASGRFKKGHQVGERTRARAAPEPEDEAASEAPEAVEEQSAASETEEPEAPAEPETAAPAGWAKEAKAEWAKLPKAVQAAVSKRETDMEKGVKELKTKYEDVERAYLPYMDAIRQNGHTPAQAVEQLFGWFRALQANPDIAFPALAQSFKYDLRRVLGEQQPPADQPKANGQAAPAQPAGEINPAVQQYINGMKAEMDQLKATVQQQLGGFQQNFQQQQQAKTEETLSIWAKDKPYFDEVRNLMAHLIGSGAVPLNNGNVDLDKAYDMALYGNPEVRAKVLQEQRQKETAERKTKAEAEKKAQAEAAEKARKAAVGLPPSAPGTSSGAKKELGRGKTVAQSIRDSIEELSS
jgi:hypothetical protein